MGPDFPSGAEIIACEQEIKEVYETGRGSKKARAVYELERGECNYSAPVPSIGGKNFRANC